MKRQLLLGMLVFVNCAYGMDTKPPVGKSIVPFVKQPTALEMLQLWIFKRMDSVSPDGRKTRFRPITFGQSRSIERDPKMASLIEEEKILTVFLMKERRKRMLIERLNDPSRDPGSH